MKISHNTAMFLILLCLFWSTSFSAAVDRRVNVAVVDAESGEALAARLYLTAESQVPYYFQAADAKSLPEKGSDPLRRGQKLDENDSPPKGQTPFRTLREKF